LIVIRGSLIRPGVEFMVVNVVQKGYHFHYEGICTEGLIEFACRFHHPGDLVPIMGCRVVVAVFPNVIATNGQDLLLGHVVGSFLVGIHATKL